MKALLASILMFASPMAFAALDISIGGLVEAVVWLIIVGLIVGLLLWAVAKAPWIPEPWKTGITYFIYFVCVLIALNFLLGLVGTPIFRLR